MAQKVLINNQTGNRICEDAEGNGSKRTYSISHWAKSKKPLSKEEATALQTKIRL